MPKGSKPGAAGPSGSSPAGQAEPAYSIHTNMAGAPASKELAARYEFLKSLAAQAHQKRQDRPPTRPGAAQQATAAASNAAPPRAGGAAAAYPDVRPQQDQFFGLNQAHMNGQGQSSHGHKHSAQPQGISQGSQASRFQGLAHLAPVSGPAQLQQPAHDTRAPTGNMMSPSGVPPRSASVNNMQGIEQAPEPLCIDIKVVTAEGQQTGELKCPLGNVKAVPCNEVQLELKALYGRGSLFLNLKGDKRALCLPSVDLLPGRYTYQLAAPRDSSSMSSSASVVSMATTSAASHQMVHRWLQQQQPPEELNMMGPLESQLHARRSSPPAENGIAMNADHAPIVNRFNQLFAKQERPSTPSHLRQLEHSPAAAAVVAAPVNAEPSNVAAMEPVLTSSGRLVPAPLPMPGGGWWFHHNKYLAGHDINDDKCMELMQSPDMMHVRRMAQYVHATYGKNAEAFACNGFIKHTFHPDLLQSVTGQEGMPAPVGLWERFQDGMGVPDGWMYMPGFYAVGDAIEDHPQQQVSHSNSSIALLAMRAQRSGAVAFATDGRMFRTIKRVVKPANDVAPKIGIFRGLFIKVADD